MHRPEVEEDRHILGVLIHLQGFYDVIKSQPYQMSATAKAEVRFHMEEMLQNYRELSSAAFFATPRRKRWKDIPKHHYCQHLSDQCQYGNPAYSWTYGDEDFMSLVKKLAESCVLGTRVTAAVLNIIRKWGLGCALRCAYHPL